MSPKIPVKCVMAGCHRRLKMTPEQREELRRVGQERNAVAGIVTEMPQVREGARASTSRGRRESLLRRVHRTETRRPAGGVPHRGGSATRRPESYAPGA